MTGCFRLKRKGYLFFLSLYGKGQERPSEVAACAAYFFMIVLGLTRQQVKRTTEDQAP